MTTSGARSLDETHPSSSHAARPSRCRISSGPAGMQTEEMANVAVFMASDKASGMTGTTINLTMGSLDDQRLTTEALLRASARLRPTSDATTVQVLDGKVLISDGPFAKTKEQIGGYCLIVGARAPGTWSDLRVAGQGQSANGAIRLPGSAAGSSRCRPGR